MSEFETLQSQLRDAQAKLESASRDVAARGQEVRALELRARSVARRHGEDSRERQALRAEQKQASAAAEKARTERAALRERYDTLVKSFLPFSDPRENVGRLSDSAPFLLFPVRLETRFKTVTRDGDVSHELWVRVFPDQCSIDTFDDLLSASEVVRAQNYWASVWAAGTPATEALAAFVRDKQLAAFRKLMGSFNAGRAHWISTHYVPLNPSEMPVRNAETDVLPVIVCTGPAPAQRDALCRYWEAVITAGGRPAGVAVALAALQAETGLAQAEAEALVKAYEPRELAAILEAGAPEGDVRVTFVLFEADTDAKQSAWGRAAKVRTFPERFVLLGYQGNDAPPVVSAIGAPVPDPLIVGPDAPDDVEALLVEAFGDAVATMSDEEKAAKYVEYLSQRSETSWLFDFDRAVALGLAFRVRLSSEQYRRGFTRLLVLGVRLGTGAAGGKAAVEELFRNHQFGDSGFSLLRQGTPTNNTEDGSSGFSIQEQPEEAFDRYSASASIPDEVDGEPVDGRHLARALGIDAVRAALPTAQNYATTDQAEARAMQTALWHATLGYFLEALVPALTSEAERAAIRGHFLEHVRGRGAVPSVRIGKQPYGILTLANLRDFSFPSAVDTNVSVVRPRATVLSALFQAATIARADLASVLRDVAHVGAGTDAHATLLRVLGLHPTSVEYDRRVGESFLALRNALLAQGLEDVQVEAVRAAYRESGLALLEHLGYRPPAEGEPPSFPLFDRAFFREQEDVRKPPIDDGPLSEERRLGVCTPDGKNYIEWLVQKAQTDHDAVRRRSGFLPGKTPQAILFDLLCHSLNLEFGEAGISLLRKVQVIDGEEASALRRDKELIGVQKRSDDVESKWDLIYRTQPEVAEDATVVSHIQKLLAAGSAEDSVSRLASVVEALSRLASLPTARLERLLAEHVDLCHYRLDAWLLSFVAARLAAMRATPSEPNERESGGIYLGAYGWVEDLRPQARTLEPVELDSEQQKAFDPGGAGGIVRDGSNAGYVHAPSLPQGLTAAVLRNAYISTASSADPERYKVNLSSERVRMALGIIEGIQQGQGLAELLGYQLERGLHDRTDLELDVFVYELRKVFPLRSNRLRSTAVRKGRTPKNAKEATRFAEEEAELAGDRAVTKVEARHVVNGLALLEHVEQSGNASYPFGFPTGTGPGELRDASAPIRDAIDAEVERLKNLRDAVADLALAESVHQTVQGNYERAAGALDAFSKGAFPQLPEVIQSPGSGLGLTHRFAVHFPAGVSPDAGQTPRSKAEPALNAWLEDLFPPAASLHAAVRFRPRPDAESPPPAWSTFPVTLASLGLEPIDLLYLHDAESAKNLNALDDHVLRAFRGAAPRRLDLELELDYLDAPAGKVSFFELGALLTELRTLVVAARPLEASDLSLQNEGGKTRNGTARIAPERIQKAKAMLDTELAALNTQVIAPLAPLVDLDDRAASFANFPGVLASIDGVVDKLVASVGALGRFGMEGAGTAFVSERLRALRNQLTGLVRERAERWRERSEQYQKLVDEELPLATTEEQKIEILHRAETLVSTTFTTVFADANALGAAVTAKRASFEQKRAAAATFLTQGFTTLAQLFAQASALLAGTEAFELDVLDVTEAKNAVVVLAEELLRQATKLHARGSENSTAVEALLSAAPADPAGGVAPLTQAAHVLFGEGFRIFPEVTLASENVLELQRCLAGRAQLLAYQTNVAGTDDPTEDFLYGVARVREKLAAWESSAILAEGFVDRQAQGRAPLALTPIQLPYRDGDSWLALSFPPEHVIEGDNLLYTAVAPGFDPEKPVVGALVDEWTETIPSRSETTALTFHYDRPNCEAPQSLLLVTPAAATGRWEWTDLVGALHEALDLARLRALEPDLLDRTVYARVLPATVATLTVHPVTIAMNFALQTLATTAATRT